MRGRVAEFLRKPRVAGSRPKVLLTAYLLAGLGVVFLGAILYTGRAARQMDRQAAVLTRVFSLFLGESVLRADQAGSREVIESILREVEFPIILTDAANTPVVWRNVGVPAQTAERPDDLARPDLSAAEHSQRAQLDVLVREFDLQNPPHPIRVNGALQAYLHFGPSKLSGQLRWVPLLLVATMAMFTTVALLVFRYMKMTEQRSIWVGMARETAHQLGTPLTSLLGWVQLLQSQDDPETPAEQARARRAETYAEMERDLERLSKVSARFSKIGSKPDLVPLDLTRILAESVQYIDRRMPHLGGTVQILTDIGAVPPVSGNRELLEWAFENLLKNALDALGKGGEIRVRAEVVDGAVEVRVADTGKGIPREMRSRVFQPGFTTKRRGWGLGLALVLRIIEEYHGGHIWIEDNPDRRGVCFTMRLPIANQRPPQNGPGA